MNQEDNQEEEEEDYVVDNFEKMYLNYSKIEMELVLKLFQNIRVAGYT